MVALDDDARAYLALRRQAGSSLRAGALNASSLRDEERSLRARYGHGPVLWRERLVPEGLELPRHFVLEPRESPPGTILYIHGGGWVMGEPEDYLSVCRALCHESGWRVIVTDYAKAPEHPFPMAYNQCLRLAQSLLSNPASQRDAQSHSFAIAGDSAGGGIAAAIAAELSSHSSGRLAAQILITPVLDSKLDRPSYLDPDRQLSLTRSNMAWFFDQYAPASVDRADPRISPLRSGSLRSLPETLIVSAGSDVLASEIEEYTVKLRAANVSVRERAFPGQMHGFFQLHNVMRASRVAVNWIAEQLNELETSMTRHTPKGWQP